MKYYAMIDGQRVGPFELAQLPAAGVSPATYVWCKGMPDWQRADEVADICRFWRQHLASIKNPSSVLPVTVSDKGESIKDKPEAEETSAIGRRWIIGPENDTMANPTPEMYNQEPPSTLIWAVLSTILCMPFTGIAAIYFSIMASREWQAAKMEKGETVERLHKAAWEHSRLARMFTGISLFLGFILWAFVFRFLL